MLTKLSCLLAMAMVLLPIGGLSYNAQADIPAAASACQNGGAWLGIGIVTEPGTAGLIFMGVLWFVVRRYGLRGRGSAGAD
jgi:hypothetical protein